MPCTPHVGIVVDENENTWEKPYFTHLPHDSLSNLELFRSNTVYNLWWVEYNHGMLKMTFQGNLKAVLTYRGNEQ